VKDLQFHIDSTWTKLKDFQRATVNYTIDQFFVQGRNKMLIADEVGLGKTIVSRGIVAKMFEQHYQAKEDEMFNVIYICSNQAIAKQNIEKLNFLQGEAAKNIVDYNSSDDRITALAYQPRETERAFNFRIKAFTPATSFDQNSASGRSDERVLLLRLILAYPEFQQYRNELSWLFKNNRMMKDDNWKNMVEDALQFDSQSNYILKHHWNVREIRPEIYIDFRKRLEEIAQIRLVPTCYAFLNSKQEINWINLLLQLCSKGIGETDYWNRNELKELLKSLRILVSELQ
jgi:hypothetical protein